MYHRPRDLKTEKKIETKNLDQFTGSKVEYWFRVTE